MVAKVFGSGINKLTVVHRPGRANVGADALSRNPVTDISSKMDIEAVVSSIDSTQQIDITTLLCAMPCADVSEVTSVSNRERIQG